MRLVLLFSAAVLLCAPAVNCGAQTSAAPSASPASGATQAAVAAPQASAGEDPAALRQALQEKRKELAKLRHQWAVAKGRTPTEKEIEEFEKKQKEGKASYKDNPYVNRSALQRVWTVREAYYKTLEEVRQTEERLGALEEAKAAGAAQPPGNR